MSLVLANAKKPYLLEQLRSTFNAFRLHLYKSNTTPDGASSTSSFTECDFPGYVYQNLDDFGTAFLNADNQGEMVADLHTFTRSSTGAGQDVYGYYVTDVDGNLIYAERHPSAPVSLTTSGDTYAVLPRIKLDTLVP